MSGRRCRYDVLIDVLTLVLGTFLCVAPWVFGFASLSGAGGTVLGTYLGTYDACACGAAVGLMAAASIVEFSEWEEWANFLIGQWVVGAPWLLGFSPNAAARWAHVSVGLAITGLAGFAVCLAEHRSQRPGTDVWSASGVANRPPSKRDPISSRRPPLDEPTAQATVIELTAGRARLMKKRAFLRKYGGETSPRGMPKI